MDEPLELVKRWLQRRQNDLAGSQGSVIGVDIGSYGLRAIVADLQGQQVVADHRPLPTGNADTIVEQVLDLTRGVLQQMVRPQHVARIGLGFGGPVDINAGVTRLSHRASGWENYPLATRFEDAFDAPAMLDNDANVTALGEATCGAGADRRNLFYLHLSSGVGGGIVLDGRLYHGTTMIAGEIGHVIVRYDGPPCSCGGNGHLESYVSIGGLLRRVNELGLRTDDLEQVFGEEQAGKQTVAEATEMLGRILANVATLLDPEMIVIGGTVGRIGGEAFIQAISNQLQAGLPPTMRRDVPVVASTFGHDSVAVGALALAACSLSD
ncbi:MAG TPA: ROK family protein [Herpetosiphonaceae bacterium]